MSDEDVFPLAYFQCTSSEKTECCTDEYKYTECALKKSSKLINFRLVEYNGLVIRAKFN